MSIETPADKAVFMLCEWTAGALIFGFIEGISATKPVGTLAIYAVLAILFAIAGVVWPRLKTKLRARYANFVLRIEQIAGDYRYKTGAAFLLLGYFTASAGMYVHSLRNDLDMYIRPRTISETQSERLRDYLSKHDAYAVSIKVVQHDQEAMEYAGRLFAAIRQTNWDLDPPNHDGPGYVRNPMTVKKPKANDADVDGKPLYKNTEDYLNARDAWLEMEMSSKMAEQVNDNTGLCIEVEVAGQPTNPDPRHPTPDSIMRDAMRYAGIDVNCGGGSANNREYTMYFLVGHRPRIIGNEEPTIRKIGRWIGNLGRQ
jgi:hypothetical protein